MRLLLLTLLLACLAIPAQARHYDGLRGHTIGWARGSCVSARCFRKHPGGTYFHPITSRLHRR